MVGRMIGMIARLKSYIKSNKEEVENFRNEALYFLFFNYTNYVHTNLQYIHLSHQGDQ